MLYKHTFSVADFVGSFEIWKDFLLINSRMQKALTVYGNL